MLRQWGAPVAGTALRTSSSLRIRRRTLRAQALRSLSDGEPLAVACVAERDTLSYSVGGSSLARNVASASVVDWRWCKARLEYSGILFTSLSDAAVFALDALRTAAMETDVKVSAKVVRSLLLAMHAAVPANQNILECRDLLVMLREADPISALPLCAGLVDFARETDLVIPVPMHVAIADACQRAARHHRGDKGGFTTVLPLAAQRISHTVEAAGGDDEAAPQKELMQAAKALVGVARLAAWPTPLLVMDALPPGIASEPYVQARCLGSAAFAFRHWLATPRSNLTGIPQQALRSDDVERLLRMAQRVVRRPDGLPRTVDSVLAEGVRHGIAALLAVGAVGEASAVARELETAIELSAFASQSPSRPSSSASSSTAAALATHGGQLHWTHVEVRLQEGNLQGAVEACRQLGAGRRDGWTVVPSVVVDCVTRLAAACGSHSDAAASLCLPFLIAVGSFRAPSTLPVETMLTAYMDAFVAALKRREDQGEGRRSAPLIAAMAGILASVAPLVSLEVAWGFSDAVLRQATPDATICAAAVWRVLECSVHAQMGHALLEHLAACESVYNASILEHIPSQLSSFPSAASRGGPLSLKRSAVAPVTVVWTCAHCSSSHGSPSSTCAGCGASRFHTSTCGSCHGSVAPTMAMATQPSQPQQLRDACVLCGRDGTNPMYLPGHCRACGKAWTAGELHCTSCGALSDAVSKAAAPSVWQCHVCCGWSAWTDATCRHCQSWHQLPASPRCQWRETVRSVPCAGCRHGVLTPLERHCGRCGTAVAVTSDPASSTATSEEARGQQKAAAVFVRQCDGCFDAVLDGPAMQQQQQQPSCSTCGATNTYGRAVCHLPWGCLSCGTAQPATHLSLLCTQCLGLSPKRPAELEVYFATAKHALVVKDPAQLYLIVSSVADALAGGSTATTPKSQATSTKALVPLVAHASSLANSLATRAQRQLAAAAHALGAFVGIEVLPAATCPHCAASHPEAMCADRPSPVWDCEDCGHRGNSNRGATRYVCQGCMQVRRLLFELPWSDAWECESCSRVSCECDDACAHCGEPRVLKSSDSVAAEALPFYPARCASCGEVHLEALCPVCHRDDGVRDEINRGRAMAALDHLHSGGVSSSSPLALERGSDDDSELEALVAVTSAKVSVVGPPSPIDDAAAARL